MNDNDRPFGERLAVVEAELKANTELTKSTAAKMDEQATNVAAMLEMFAPLQGGFRAIQGLGKIAAALTPFAVFGAAVWALLHGKMPKWGD